MTARSATIALALLLTACAHTEPKERLVIQEVKVPVPCTVELEAESVLPIDQEPVEADIFSQMRSALSSIDLLKADRAEARAAVRGCSGLR